jgi:hypothetical protein
MAEYRATETSAVIRRADAAWIPDDVANVDRQAFQAWLAEGHMLDPVVPSTPVPGAISDRQFFQQLTVQGLLSQQEALNAVKTGDIPAALQQVIDGLPPGQQFEATMMISGATTFERSHPLTIAIGAAYGWTVDRIDALFRAAAVL